MTFIFPPIPFYFLRHGVTDHNQRHLIMGQLDVPLNDTGRRQAASSIPLLAAAGIAGIVSSPLSRALETAQIVGRGLRVQVDVVEGLRERDWGELSGHTHRELMRHVTPPGGETAEAFAGRVLAAVCRLTEPGPILVVAHSGVCRVIRRHLAIGDADGPVPNAQPLLYAPASDGGWRETPVPARRAVSTART